MHWIINLECTCVMDSVEECYLPIVILWDPYITFPVLFQALSIYCPSYGDKVHISLE